MWPERGDALSRTIEAEAAVADLYAETLRLWAPAARAAALPALTASVLPPDPDALTQTQPVWDQHADEIIIVGMGIVWAATVYETTIGLGGAISDLAVPDVSTVVLGIVLASLLMKRSEVLDAVAYVEASPSLAVARDEFLHSMRAEIGKTPARVQAKVSARVKAATQMAADANVSPAVAATDVRAAASTALDPAGSDMRDVARNEGYQAAGVMNHAVITAASQQNEEFAEKTWISTLDGKTRPTHWAADGQRVPLLGKFTIGGEEMSHPGDETASPGEWKNCRCRVGVLAKDEALPDEVDRHTERLDGRDSVAINRDGRTQQEEIDRRSDAGNIRARDDQDGIGRVASGGWTAPSEQEYEMPKPSDLATKLRSSTTMAAEDGDNADDEETYMTFTDALFAVTGTPTSDGRMLASDIKLTFRDTPMPLQWCEEMEGGHYGSVTVGVIESIRLKDGEVLGSGYMLNNENAGEAIDLVSHGVCNPSIDPGGDDFEMIATYEDGTVVTEENYDPDQKIYATMTVAEILATTIVAIPAFGQTRIRLNEQREPRAKTLVASAVEQFRPRVYDQTLFADPNLSGPTRLTITEDGHIFGHLAEWNSRHRSVGLGHIKPPRSRSAYQHFHASPPVHLSDGTLLPVGRLTVGIGHAPTMGISNAAAQAHYDNTEACFALVRAGEDQHGIWVSGVAAPWASPERVEMGLSAPLSGDWRPYGSELELVAALAVNTPGFLCSGGTTDSRGVPTAMVASFSPMTSEAGGIEHHSRDDIKAIVMEAMDESQRRGELAARQTAALAQAHESVGPPPTPAERIDELLAVHEGL